MKLPENVGTLPIPMPADYIRAVNVRVSRGHYDLLHPTRREVSIVINDPLHRDKNGKALWITIDADKFDGANLDETKHWVAWLPEAVRIWLEGVWVSTGMDEIAAWYAAWLASANTDDRMDYVYTMSWDKVNLPRLQAAAKRAVEEYDRTVSSAVSNQKALEELLTATEAP